MRLVLQSTTTSLYLCKDYQWTPRFKEAHDFGSVQKVIEFFRGSQPTDLQLIIILERNGRIHFVPFPLERLLNSPPTEGATAPMQHAVSY